MTQETDLQIIAQLTQEVYRLQGEIKRMMGDVKGHKSHVMDVIAPNGNGCDGPIVVTFGDRTARVSHKHTVTADALSKRYPYKKRPELWELTPASKVVHALLPADKVRAMQQCGDSYVVIS